MRVSEAAHEMTIDEQKRLTDLLRDEVPGVNLGDPQADPPEPAEITDAATFGGIARTAGLLPGHLLALVQQERWSHAQISSVARGLGYESVEAVLAPEPT